MKRFDLAVVGSGSAAFAAAIAARERGLSVAMVERATVGGTCVNVGCVPSKALLAAASARQSARRSQFRGIETSASPVVLSDLIAAKQALVERMRADKYVDLAAEYGWEIISGTARFAPSAALGAVLEVDLEGGGTTTIAATHHLVATGAHPYIPPLPGLDQVPFLTSESAMDLTTLPASLLVVGGNYVGLEQAQLFARLGCAVTVIEAAPRLAPGEEPEVGGVLADAFAKEGMAVLTSTEVVRLSQDRGGISATVLGPRGEATHTAAAILIATGRRPNTAGLGLRSVGVGLGPKGEVLTDAHQATTNPAIWAAGDVTGGPQFVYVAAAQGAAMVEAAFGRAPNPVSYATLPRVIFTSPNVAGAGLTEAEATALGIQCSSRVVDLSAVPRAIVNGDVDGFVKLVAEQGSGRLVGATVVGEGAADSILSAVYAIKANMTTTDLADTWAPYLTMSEALRIAAQSFTRDISKLSCCA